MKKSLIFSLALLALLSGILAIFDGKSGLLKAKVAEAEVATTPQSAPPAATVYEDLGPSAEVYHQGLWNGGKAVFSDWKWMDFLWNEKYRRGYRPKQPINFNHQVHLEKNKMECQYCHSGVNKSAFATIPSVELCMGCHKAVRTDRPDIVKLKEHYDKGEPVNWVSVNNLPEHVRFNHKRHIKAGVTCQSCHGQVQKMAVVERVSSFKMGFCISCHRDNGASTECAVCHY